jgi:ubiquinone/menaquinone biosynthesis C-methylase UbiE
MVTVDCFLDDVPKAFSETHRILSPGGSFVVALLDKNGAYVKKYERSGSLSYQNAQFHSPAEIVGWMTEAGFSDFQFAQTLFLEDPPEPEPPKYGMGAGSFAVIEGKASKLLRK